MTCPICHGSTFISVEKDGETIAVPCQCRKDREKKTLLNTKRIDARIPPKLWDFTFESYSHLPMIGRENDKESIETFKKILDNPFIVKEKDIQVIWIYGKNDNACHTSLAIILGTAFLEKDFFVRFITFQELMNNFTEFNTRVSYFEELEKYQVYIIDNAFDSSRAGAFGKGDYSQKAAFNWVNTALSNGKILICTCNVPIRQISDEFKQSKIVLLRSFIELNFLGTIITESKSI
ncbi:MAG TPA: hypothetical protein P5136_00515 [Methanofastidiosum sp.]|nr:hypothetical protein [Methanofastidiosum sp.]